MLPEGVYLLSHPNFVYKCVASSTAWRYVNQMIAYRAIQTDDGLWTVGWYANGVWQGTCLGKLAHGRA